MKPCYYTSLENEHIKLARNILRKKRKESYQIIKHRLITLIMAQEYTEISVVENEFRNRPKYIWKLA